MGVYVVIIGHNQIVRIDPSHIARGVAAGSQLPPLICPTCMFNTRVFIAPDATEQDGTARVYDSTPAAKPAEMYVLHFNADTEAQTWLRSVPGAQLAGKEIYMLDPDTGATAPKP